MYYRIFSSILVSTHGVSTAVHPLVVTTKKILQVLANVTWMQSLGLEGWGEPLLSPGFPVCV